jgi:biotin carboxyl carrier protein
VSARRFAGTLVVGEERLEVDLAFDHGRLRGTVDGSPVDVEVSKAGDGEVVLGSGARARRAVVVRRPATTWVSIGGRALAVARAGADRDGAHRSADPFATSPMTGLVTKVAVAPGAAVRRGDALFSVEAMKMEYVVRADRDARVSEVRAAAGDRVSLGQVVVSFLDA